MDQQNSTHRRGRKRKGAELRVSLTFSVDPSVREMASRLRYRGYNVNDAIARHIATMYESQLGAKPLQISE